MDQRPSAKGPAIVRLAGWIMLAFSLVGLNPVGVVAGFLILRYADLTSFPFCRKMNEPNTGKCRYCGYAM